MTERRPAGESLAPRAGSPSTGPAHNWCAALLPWAGCARGSRTRGYTQLGPLPALATAGVVTLEPGCGRGHGVEGKCPGVAHCGAACNESAGGDRRGRSSCPDDLREVAQVHISHRGCEEVPVSGLSAEQRRGGLATARRRWRGGTQGTAPPFQLRRNRGKEARNAAGGHGQSKRASAEPLRRVRRGRRRVNDLRERQRGQWGVLGCDAVERGVVSRVVGRHCQALAAV